MKRQESLVVAGIKAGVSLAAFIGIGFWGASRFEGYSFIELSREPATWYLTIAMISATIYGRKFLFIKEYNYWYDRSEEDRIIRMQDNEVRNSCCVCKINSEETAKEAVITEDIATNESNNDEIKRDRRHKRNNYRRKIRRD